jgi:hypothetical protein
MKTASDEAGMCGGDQDALRLIFFAEVFFESFEELVFLAEDLFASLRVLLFFAELFAARDFFIGGRPDPEPKWPRYRSHTRSLVSESDALADTR